jgi:methylated-DNA-[protein]-cysteine S-methyltransferase
VNRHAQEIDVAWTRLASPLGDLLLTSDGEALTGVRFDGHAHAPPLPERARRDDRAAVFSEARRQLAAYFAGELRSFTLRIAPRGSELQQKVWAALREIPYGATSSYGALARRLGAAGHARAVGHANARNPLSIVVPCHRVVGADGALTGYAGGVARKRWLLAHEGARSDGADPRERSEA